ncbi:5-(carboxyamino)imidazole ribonucleotide synthase [Pacificimonas flava]|uniref:N5-carboxyaminoimidazole ribonucleotide synthase n=2 Tax=Pacificimonas TaxID=1960290 RepID=A0A219B1E6_9SPHN|nr:MULTISPECIES: 5-(carboxyamino)imidazole ribonucleotide synthase [Pacificimonas]MBZ6380055.1 5-(carboxyamino)imidazole ribonucleotide synthase [Pacificimonas aurantium]OWV32024.1 5-(carboxyamino)imidazole ribonucleotide synthase [Pacificimonas flava]
MIPPSSTIGIVGGGQLGRMLSIAAAYLGYRCHIYAPDEAPPAGDVAAKVTRGAYDDLDALGAFAKSVDVATFEFENVDAGALAYLGEHVRLAPGPEALATAQERVREKRFVRDLGGRTAPFRSVESLADLERAAAEVGRPGILKTARFGYDGKGQVRIGEGSNLAEAWADVGEQPCIYEGFVDFAAEFSILIARGMDGQSLVYPVPRNEHRDGILARSTVPAGDPISLQAEDAADLARAVADRLDYVGLLTLEFFAGAEGPVFNEMAPRVHNSGHWTIEGARTSQFENHIRAICGLPLGDTSLSATDVEMRNLLGAEVEDWPSILTDPSAHLHVYGKGEIRPGRKMGHVTRLRY